MVGFKLNSNNMKDIKVNSEDRYEGIEYLRMALAMCEIEVDYPTAELVDTLVTETRRLKGKFDFEDGIKIFRAWKTKWRLYFEDQSKKDEEHNNKK